MKSGRDTVFGVMCYVLEVNVAGSYGMERDVSSGLRCDWVRR